MSFARGHAACSAPQRPDGLNHFCSLYKKEKPAAHRLISQSQSGFYLLEPSHPVSCAAVPHRGPTAVRRSIHRLSVPSHRRPLPPRAATPALNGESPSGGEAQRPRGFRGRQGRHLQRHSGLSDPSRVKAVKAGDEK